MVDGLGPENISSKYIQVIIKSSILYIYLELQCMHSDACIPVYNQRNNNYNVNLLLRSIVTLIHEALI